MTTLFATDTALEFGVLGSTRTLRLTGFRALVAGYTGRDEAAVRHHIDELAAIGVAPPPQVPMFYPVDPDTITTADRVTVSGSYSSGEVEPVLIRHDGRWYLGVGSDHTDRELETVDIGDSKRACPKPIGATVVEIEEWAGFDWDGCQARSWVDGLAYQTGTLDGLRTPADLLATLDEREGDDGGDLVCFAGTLPLIDGAFVPGGRWEMQLTLPDGHAVTHAYTTTL